MLTRGHEKKGNGNNPVRAKKSPANWPGFSIFIRMG